MNYTMFHENGQATRLALVRFTKVETIPLHMGAAVKRDKFMPV